jgi:NAD(P)-dependent dehydrogenase (short-subunit alcohol dehydrogenase family)
MGEMSGKVAIVTGASQGLGRGMAIAFGEAGASVVCAARNVEKLRETCAAVEKAGGKAVAVACDVRKLEDVENCVAKAVEMFGSIDVVVNNAQTIQYVYLDDASDQTMLDTLHSGPLASYRFMQCARPHLKARGGGVIVNVGSPAQNLPVTARYACYNAAKAGIEALTRAASDEWKSDNIYTFMISPTAETAMTLAMKAREPERYAREVAAFPKGRYGDPLEDIGRPLVRLITHAERFTGKSISINSKGVGEIIKAVEDVPFALP